MTDNVETELDELANEVVGAAFNGDEDAIREVAAALDDETVDDEEEKPVAASGRGEALTLQQQIGEIPSEVVARAALRPATQAGIVSYALLRYGTGMWARSGNLTIDALAAELATQVKAVTERDLDCGEAMLAAQAHTLDALYSALVLRSVAAEGLAQMQALMKLALRAQSQCRATWEAISGIQNPPLAGYVNQANIANTQQVNNGPPRRTRENQNPPNKLLEQTTHEPDQWMDRRASAAATGSDSPLEAVEKVDRTVDGRRQG